MIDGPSRGASLVRNQMSPLTLPPPSPLSWEMDDAPLLLLGLDRAKPVCRPSNVRYLTFSSKIQLTFYVQGFKVRSDDLHNNWNEIKVMNE